MDRATFCLSIHLLMDSVLLFFSFIIEIVLMILRISILLCCSVDKSCLTLYDAMDGSLPTFPVLYCLPELAQTCVH